MFGDVVMGECLALSDAAELMEAIEVKLGSTFARLDGSWVV